MPGELFFRIAGLSIIYAGEGSGEQMRKDTEQGESISH
jgi:hypothetical protein